MARKNDLEIRPAHEGEAAQQIRARIAPPSTNDKGQVDIGGNGEVCKRPEDSNAWDNETIDGSSRNGELESDDADNLAGLINDASLSGANIPGNKPVDKPSTGTLSRTINFMTTLFVGSSQKPTEFSSANNTSMSQSSSSQTHGKQSQLPPKKIPDNSAQLSGDKTLLGKSLARPSAIYEDISKMQKPRRSGLPDPYDVPQSPPSSPAPEPKPTTVKLRGPKHKRAVTKENPEQVTMRLEEAPAFAEEEPSEVQELIEHTEMAHCLASGTVPASEERNTKPKRATRSTRTKTSEDLEEFQRQRERYQRKAMKGSREHFQFSSPTQPSALTSKVQLGDQDVGNQAGLPAVDLVEFENDLKGLSGNKIQSKNKDPLTGRRDTQPRENVQVTPTKRHSQIEKGSAQKNAQPEIIGISPILLGPTPAKGLHESPRRLQRPSQRPSLIPRATQTRKSFCSTQHRTRQHSVQSAAHSRILEHALDEASDEEDNIHSESDVSRAPTPRAMGSTEDGAASFIEEETLQYLRSTIKKAGERKGKRVIRDHDYRTSNARILTGGLRRLISRYKAMKDLRSAKVLDVNRINMEHGKALQYLEIIREKTQAVLNDRLGDEELGGRNADKTSRSHMLEDLYLYIIPGLVEALYCAVHSRQARDGLELSDLEESYTILKILHDLVKATRAEDKSVQPKAPTRNSYSISQPTRSLWTTLQILYEQCGKKLAARKVTRSAEQLQKALPGRATKRKERLEAEKREEEEKFQHRLRERNKAIIASLNERRAELGLPPCSQPIDTLSNSQHPQTSKYKAEESFDDVDHDTGGRLTGVFGRNNSHPGTIPKEWTKVEMEILVDGLRRERGTCNA